MMTDPFPHLTDKQRKLAQLGIPLFSPRFGDRLSATLDNQAQRLRLSPAERAAISTSASTSGQQSGASVLSSANSATTVDDQAVAASVPISGNGAIDGMMHTVMDEPAQSTVTRSTYSSNSTHTINTGNTANTSDEWQTGQLIVQLPEVDEDPFHPQDQAAADKWPDLCRRIREQPAPSLSNQPVPIMGEGDSSAAWMLIGDAPGMVEEQSGRAYSGQAGQLLNQLFLSLHVNRSQGLYVTHVVKHRPPNDRDPLPEEIEAAWLYLLNEIHLIQPKMIVVVGRLAAQKLLKTEAAVGNLRGRIHRIQVHPGDAIIPLLVTHSPSYLMKSPSQKANTWEDILSACHHLSSDGKLG